MTRTTTTPHPASSRTLAMAEGEDRKSSVGAKVPALWHDQLEYLAKQQGVNVSDILRKWIGCGLSHADLTGFRLRREVTRDPSSAHPPRRQRRK